VGEKPYSSGGDCEDTEGRGREAGRERESERVRGGMQIHVSIYRLHIYIFYCGLYSAGSCGQEHVDGLIFRSRWTMRTDQQEPRASKQKNLMT
jgi:hypothetical protein